VEPINTISQYIDAAQTVPLWAWVAVAVGVVAISMADDRRAIAASAMQRFDSLPARIRFMLGSSAVGFAIGWFYPPAALADIVGLGGFL